MANEFVVRNGLIAQNNSIVSGSLIVSGSSSNFIGSFNITGSDGTTKFSLENDIIKTISGSSDVGLKLDFANNQYFFGNQNQMHIQALYSNLDNFIQFGDLNDFGNETKFLIDDFNQKIEISHNASQKGLLLDFYNNEYKLGDFSNVVSGSSITINDITKTISITGSLTTTGSVFFKSLTQQSQANVVLIDTASGQLYFTASSAIGGGGSGAGFPYSGSAIITGSLLVSGSGIAVTGSLNADNITGSLFGTSSWAQSASNAINAQTSSFLTTGTYLITSSWASNATTASYITSSFFTGTNAALSASYTSDFDEYDYLMVTSFRNTYNY